MRPMQLRWPISSSRPEGVFEMEETGAIDFCALERELQAAVAADEKYQRENDAKFRAVHQKVASYEEFRDIVLASHLKPLEKKDKMGKKKNLLWNSYATQANGKQDREMELAQGWDGLPETSADFYRYWRRCLKSGQERYQFLFQLGVTRGSVRILRWFDAVPSHCLIEDLDWLMEMRLVGIAILLGMADVLHAFAIMEKEDVFKKTPCPAFLMFDNAAYLADMSFELPCKCKPEEVTSVVWYFQKSMGSRQTKVLTDFDGTMFLDSGHIRVGSHMLKRFSIRMFSLIIFRAQVEDSGHYLCGTKEGDFFYGYDVDVQSSKAITVAFEDRNQHPQKDHTEEHFSVFTTFWDWTKCDRCGVRGEQWRIGLCYVKSAYLYPRYRTVPTDVVSCGSRSVPRRFQGTIRLRKPEVVIRSCLTPCVKRKGPEEGVLSISNLIAKVGQKPWLPKVPIQFHKQHLGSGLIIACPGARPEHAVAWDKDSTRLYRTSFLTGVNKSMRVFIDHGNHLHIRFTQLDDRGTYYCWREGQMVAGFRLSVRFQGDRKRTLDDPETRYAIKAILTSYVLITMVFVGIHISRCCYYAFRCTLLG
ncbi:Ig-like V-type domain-containing protein FAM187A isoform X1 [Caretta caretta]|uniref:Ig-like V-type domain-containing protein FAM187A isoform X1 n=2 Tax=Caretta caretta TaxID=8467 RepID=UPI0020943F8A|nr:Ig-like V-type domain-containing protein FAM187A isoform X1 [Caretta caretta]